MPLNWGLMMVLLAIVDLVEHGILVGECVGLHDGAGQAGELVVITGEGLWRGAFHWRPVKL